MSDEMFEEFVHHYSEELQPIQPHQPQPQQEQEQFIDIEAETYKKVQIEPLDKLKRFIAFYISKNPYYDDKNEEDKETEIGLRYNELETLNPRSIKDLLMILQMLFDSFTFSDSNRTDTSADSVNEHTVKGIMIPYLYCYYNHEPEFTSWNEFQECYDRIRHHIKSSSVSSDESYDSRGVYSPKTVSKSQGGHAKRFDMTEGMGGNGGSSTRRRRNLRNHRRSQYTNKKKRSSSNSKQRVSIKNRKANMKHKHTVKRRKRRRNNRG